MNNKIQKHSRPFQVQILENRRIYFFGEAQQKAEIERQQAEKEENNPEKVDKLKSRYSGERASELVKCDLIKNSDSANPYEKEQAEKKEKRIKDETVAPKKLEGKYLTASAINDNMRKLYAIMGKDWDQVRAEEEQKAKDAEQKAKEAKDKKPAEGAKPDAQPVSPDQPKPAESPDKPKTLKFDSIQRLVTESIGDNPDAPTKEAADAVTKEVESKVVGKEFKNIDEIKTVIQLAVNNMDDKYLVALAGKEMKLKAGEYNINFRFVKPGESPNQKAGIENVTMAPEVKPKDPEKPAAPQPPEKLTRIKFSKLERQQSSVDKNADAKTKEATDAVMKAIVKDTMGIEFATTDEFLKAIKYAVNGVDAKHLNALAGKDLKFKAGEYDITFNIGYTLLTPGSAPTKPAEIKDIYIGKTKPVEAPKPQEAKDKKADDKEKPAESKEVTELREDIKNKAKAIFDEYSKMSKEDLVKQGLNNANKLSYEIGVRINNIGIQSASKLSGLDKTYFIDEVTPGVGKIGFGQNGVFVESLGPYINNLFKDKKIEDSTKKETPKAFEYLTKFNDKVNEITKKYEDKAYVTQLGVTTFDEYAKKYEQEVKTAVGTIDKKLISAIEWKKLEYKTLNNSISEMVYFRLEEGKDPQISPHLARLRAKWETLNPPAKEEPAAKEEQPKAPTEEKPDPAKFNKIRPSQEAAINRGLAMSYEGVLYNDDPISIGIAVKRQLQKLPIEEQYLIPTHCMTLQGIKFQMLYYGEKMEVRVVGVTEKVAKKYVESWEKEPRATAEENEKKWAKIKCVDMYGTEKEKPEGWLKTKESFKLEKEAKEKAEAAKPKAEGADKPKEAPVEQESPEVKETRNKVETGMKKIFDKISKMSKEELSSKGVFNILHEMSLSVKTLEKDLGTDLAKLDKTYTSDKLQPPILIYFNKSGICMEKPGAWINSQFEDKGAIDTVDQKNPNAFNYTQIFTGKMVELRTKYSSKKFLTEQGITSPEDLSKKFNQEITVEMEKVDPKLVEKIEWANLPGQALVYPNYSYASFRLEKGKKISVNVNEAGMRTLFDKANAPKPAFEATSDEKAKEDAPEKIENAKTKVDQEVKDLLKKYQDMSASDISSKGFNNKLKLTDEIMAELKVLDEKLKPDLGTLEKNYSTKPVPGVEVYFNKYGIRPIGLDNWINVLYKDKKLKNIESEKGQTPNAKKATDIIMKSIMDTMTKCNDDDYLKKANISSFGDYYKLISDEITKSVKGLDPKIYEQIEWDKLTDATLRTPYTYYAEVIKTKDAKEPTLKFNYTILKVTYDYKCNESEIVDLNAPKPGAANPQKPEAPGKKA